MLSTLLTCWQIQVSILSVLSLQKKKKIDNTLVCVTKQILISLTKGLNYTCQQIELRL